MRRLGFFHGVLIAAFFALASSIVFSGLSTVTNGAMALRLVAALLGGAYVFYLLYCSAERIGRITAVATWLLVTAISWMMNADLFMTVIIQTLLISVVRGLYHHTFVLAGILDFVLSAFALSAAVWASSQSGSLFLTVWSFFLVQALSAGIPTSFTRGDQQDPLTSSVQEDKFSRALRAAETAVTRIATQR